MCTRFSFAIPREIIKRQFNINIKESELQYSYNIGAGQGAYILTNQSLDLQVYRFGFIPHWAQNEQVGLNLINASSETVATQDSFRLSVRQRRCLIFADSFYEWKRQGLHTQPYRIMLRDQKIMVFAGVWDVWIDRENRVFKTFAILTTTANQEMQPFGLRMPVILNQPSEQVRWLEEASLQTSLRLLRPLPNDSLTYYPVNPQIENLNYNSPEVHEPYQFSPDELQIWG
jgi:putative SOS response-associated peptidase YedK